MQENSIHPDTLTVYYEALNRLVAKDLKITLNAVAIEAGRSPGSIKKKREVFAPLIREIQIRAKEQRDSAKPGALQVQQAKVKASKARADATDFEAKYKAALARELMLLIAWDEVTQELRKVAKVVPIKPPIRP
jgi:phage terminase small subunit